MKNPFLYFDSSPEIRRRWYRHRCYSNWRWHLDEVFVRVDEKSYYLWLAVDQEGEVIEIFATKTGGIAGQHSGF